MARCCDPREEIAGTASLECKIGGMRSPESGSEVMNTINKIDGVTSVNYEQGAQKLTVQFDPGKVSEDHLVSTLNSLGHSVLKEYGKARAEKNKSCPVD